MNMNKDLLVLVVSVSVMFMAVMVILANSISSSDRNFAAIIESTQVINDTVRNVNSTLLESVEEELDRDRMSQVKEDIDDNQTTALLLNESATVLNLAEDTKLILEQQGNISKETREKILGDIIRNNNETIPEIFSALDENKGILLSLDNKINELFMSKNATEPATHVYNGTNSTQ